MPMCFGHTALNPRTKLRFEEDCHELQAQFVTFLFLYEPRRRARPKA